MKSLLALLFAVVAIGFVSSGGGKPKPDPEAPLCDHEECIKLRSPSPTRTGQGPYEDPTQRYRADVPPNSTPGHSIPRL